MKKSLLIIISVISISIFIALLVFQLIPFLITGGTPSSVTAPESNSPESNSPELKDLILRPEYPNNLIEGKITGIERKGSKIEFTIEVRIDRIFFNTTFDTKEIFLLADENTEGFGYDLSKEKESSIDIESFQINDQVVITMLEPNKDIITRNSYTAETIKKMFWSESKEERELESISILGRIKYDFVGIAI